MASIAVLKGCEVLVVLNKWDLEPAEALRGIYEAAGFPVLAVSAETGQGIGDLIPLIAGKLSAFTGNSGVGKSSILNAIDPSFALQVGEVSQKLGRGRHTTRHVELYALGEDTYVADTPGFSSFDTDQMEVILKENLQSKARIDLPRRGYVVLPNSSAAGASESTRVLGVQLDFLPACPHECPCQMVDPLYQPRH